MLSYDRDVGAFNPPRGCSLVAELGELGEGRAQRLHSVAPQVYRPPDDALAASCMSEVAAELS